MKLGTLSASLLALAISVLATGSGEIRLPLPGTHIAPGQSFNFSYETRADYCLSSYAYSVYLITDVPTSMAPNQLFAGGYFFGRFDAENYPAVPYPKNPAPPQLVMPDFSKGQPGFGAGQEATNQTFQLVVFEEWDGCDVTSVVGRKISFAAVPIIYNATTTSTA